MKISYHIRMENPAAHFFHVEMIVSEYDEEILNLWMAVWTPGSYLIREYSKNISSISASDENGNKLPLIKTSKNKWQVITPVNKFSVKYDVYAFEESVRTCLLDDVHASIIPAGLFIFPENFHGPFEIQFYPPENWREISTSLKKVDGDKWKRSALHFDELIDSPIEIGNQEIFQFNAAGIPHELAIFGKGNYSVEKILEDLPKIIEEELKIFGHHPCENYLFILLNSNTQRGGLEHLNSTSLIFKRFNYKPEINYNEFLALAAHEYFHLWNVKRLRPLALGPFNYERENYTTSLWIAEGFTSYYDDFILARCGIINERTYLDIVEKNLNDGLNPPGDKIASAAEASLDSWIKYYRQNENSPNSQVNYYVKGGLLAMMLDLLIIEKSNGKNSLDDVMRDAYNLFYLELNRGYLEEEFKSILEKYYDEKLDWFYDVHVFGTNPLDFASIFGKFGIHVADINKDSVETDLGITIDDKNNITHVRKNSSGEKSELNVQDEILAINDHRFSQQVLQSLIADKKPGEKLVATINRGGILRSFEIELQLTDKANYKLTVDENITSQTNSLYNRWMRKG